MIDAATLEVMRNALQSIAEEMGVTLIRTALSPNIKDRKDCSTAIYTPDGRLVAQAEHIPLHLGLMQSVVKEVLKAYPREKLSPGDALIINDPYISGSHLPDVCIFMPVFYQEEIIAIMANLAHHVDVGGMTPGSTPSNSTSIFQEGIRIPPVKIMKKGKLDEEIMEILSRNVRTSFEFNGDIRAQIAANAVGMKRFLELIDRYGKENVKNYLEELIAYSERALREEIKRIPRGNWEYVDYLEGDGISQVPLAIRLNVNINEDTISLDFNGTDSQAQGPVNSTRAVTLACVYYVVKSVLNPDIPSNEGISLPLEVNTPAGTLVNPLYPSPVSNANINTAQRIADVILGAFSKILPEKVPAASAGTMGLFTIGGLDPRSGEHYSYVETYGGGQGAFSGGDGMDGVHTNMTNTRNTPTEVIEIAYPLLVKRYSLRPDTEGPGKYRGGMGLCREIEVLGHKAQVTLSSERGNIKPWGLKGGKPGANSLNLFIDAAGKEVKKPARITTQVNPGTRIVYNTPGGGGYGLPYERDPLQVARDVKKGLISRERAEKEYVVVLDSQNLELDLEKTHNLRKKLLKDNIEKP
ncbi:MAG: hydantoinase B/oxoprolinase family protein [Candidatus Syntrophonatronum acetioxidans]|uniref:Hydantoinase B/oxoprolinase family protein n=1 Tax=Candidatus Syntrophonatronum acetioxidans TaxID=1795816 RepID=A0A424YFH6_9FIRM|nr:MAG: hydantoinase B/oxoprolinase family protein [Candidatus Syntrophonatronum acetioxidans]